MSQINRVPAGLQDLLGAKNLGVNPNDLLLAVRPTIDLTPYWSAERLTIFAAPNEVPAAKGKFTVITVPRNEAWLVTQMSCTALQFVTAGDEITYRIQARFFPNREALAANVTYVSGSFTAVGADNPGTSIFYSFPFPQLMPAGVEFSINVDHIALAAGGPTLNFVMLFVKVTL